THRARAAPGPETAPTCAEEDCRGREAGTARRGVPPANRCHADGHITPVMGRGPFSGAGPVARGETLVLEPAPALAQAPFGGCRFGRSITGDRACPNRLDDPLVGRSKGPERARYPCVYSSRLEPPHFTHNSSMPRSSMPQT